ncbi:MAG: alpha amylase C-terminal domain-containing protein, partial [Oscillospiraceae bacterium]|nr:alpha amylase C-terminal domain-containing protein [Oscillospiraceae bacterium]
NSLQNVLIPVYPDTKELTVMMSSDDEKYGGFGNVAHQTYEFKEFDGVRYVELYIPARTAIILKETKEQPKAEAPAAAEEAVNPNEAPAETAAPAAEAPKKTRKPRAKKAETVEGAEAPKKATRKRTAKKAVEAPAAE